MITPTTSRAPAVQPPAPAPVAAAPSTAPASNQQRLDETGLATAPPPAPGGELHTALAELGDLAGVVLDAMPVGAALDAAVPLLHLPGVRRWAQTLDVEQVESAGTRVLAALVDAVFPAGASLELELRHKVAVALGVATGGRVELAHRAGGAWGVAFKGLVELSAQGGVGVGLDGEDVKIGAGVGATAAAQVGAELGWTLDTARLLNADGAVRAALLRGEAPPAQGLLQAVATLAPDTTLLHAGMGGELAAEAALGEAELDVFAAHGALGEGLDALESGASLASQVLRGALGRIAPQVETSFGEDHGSVVRLQAHGEAVGRLFGLTVDPSAALEVELRHGPDADGAGPDAVRGRVTRRLGAAGESEALTQTFTGLAELDELLLAAQGVGAVLSQGELVVEREHRVDDAAAIADLLPEWLGDAGAIEGPFAHLQRSYSTRVVVRVAEDTAPALAGPAPRDAENARERQRAVAAAVLGEVYLVDLPLRAAGLGECARLESATVTMTLEAGVGGGGEVAALAKAGVKASEVARYRREVELASGLDVADLPRLLRA